MKAEREVRRLATSQAKDDTSAGMSGSRKGFNKVQEMNLADLDARLFGDRKNTQELGTTPKALANAWAARPPTRTGATRQQARAGLRRGSSSLGDLPWKRRHTRRCFPFSGQKSPL